MTVKAQIKDTKDNGLYVECALLGDGTEDNPWRPELFDKYDAYYHFDTRETDRGNHTCKVWINKKKSPTNEITKIRADAKITKIKETTAGVEK